MRNPLHFVAAVRNLVALANVAILAAERFAVSLKPELSYPCLAGTSSAARRSRRDLAWHLGDRYGRRITGIHDWSFGYGASGCGPMTTRRCDAQGS